MMSLRDLRETAFLEGFQAFVEETKTQAPTFAFLKKAFSDEYEGKNLVIGLLSQYQDQLPLSVVKNALAKQLIGKENAFDEVSSHQEKINTAVLSLISEIGPTDEVDHDFYLEYLRDPIVDAVKNELGRMNYIPILRNLQNEIRQSFYDEDQKNVDEELVNLKSLYSGLTFQQASKKQQGVHVITATFPSISEDEFSLVLRPATRIEEASLRMTANKGHKWIMGKTEMGIKGSNLIDLMRKFSSLLKDHQAELKKSEAIVTDILGSL